MSGIVDIYKCMVYTVYGSICFIYDNYINTWNNRISEVVYMMNINKIRESMQKRAYNKQVAKDKLCVSMERVIELDNLQERLTPAHKIDGIACI